MKKLYEKNELSFALVWIAIYVVGTCLVEMLGETVGTYKLVSAVFHVVMALCLFLWVKRNGLAEKYGLFLPRYRLADAWFFLPLALVCLYKVVFSPVLRFSPMESACYVISMLGVGFLEELIFRGFLFRAIEKGNSTRAVIISSVTFGAGHIVNLFNGQNILDTVGQIIFAVFVGFALVVLFHKGKSLVPCIVFHSLNNALSVFANEEAQARVLGGETAALILPALAAVLLASVYSVRNWKRLES